MNPPASPLSSLPASSPSSPSSLGGTSGAAGPGAQPGAKLRKRLPGARASAATTSAPLPEPARVLVVVHQDGYVEVFVKGENVKSKLVERRCGMTDQEFDRAIGYAWQDVNYATHCRHTALVEPPIRRIEDLVREVWELKRRYRVVSLSNVASLATISRICGASLLDCMESLTDPADMKRFQRECERAEQDA